MICRIRLTGSIDRLNVTSPFASLVNTRYQSVHGVNISMKNPISTSTFPFKNSDPKKYPNNGVHMKLISRLVRLNLTFLKLFFNSFNGISRNTPKSIRHKNIVIKLSPFWAIRLMLENIRPKITARNIIIGSNFSTKSIVSPFLGITKFVYSHI